MKQVHYRSVTRFVAENKPKGSPNIRNWLDSGGKIEVREVDGVQIWKYVDSNGEYAYCYKDHEIGKIVFPEKYVYSKLPTISIGKFTGDREVDRKLTLNKLKYDHEMDGIPKGYAHHHTYVDGEIQFIKKEIHKKFSHIGGHSVFKNRRN